MPYHTNTTGPDDNGFIDALKKALSLAIKDGTNEVLISTHTLDNLEGVISNVLGENFVKSFKKNRKTSVEGVTIFLETERTKSAFKKGPILGPFVSLKLLNKLMSDYRATDIVYVPWAPKERDQFLQENPGSVQI
ncbi:MULTISPECIES: hypothetical protein [unclassified Marinobacter]|uniref:hypothetical protein n=1 Tax=unclassified Marinobacter TaxID=83889 RepID=UPI000C5180FB|nr:hypothetical protein [Marinobacter sp.]MAO13824.1 hypothetical protein [Marinobacter sp.]|tara:strand:- start:324 stop:728 length:405 start_codon:yes stop_codon:yes gene_type:complete